MTVTEERADEATEARPDRHLTAEQTAKLLELAKGADSVELKLTVPDGPTGFRSTATALGIDALDSQIRQVFFFDTLDLLLNRHGVVVRARRSQGKPDDTVVKLRPVEPGDLPKRLRKLPDFGVEVDALPGGFVCSASYKGKLEESLVRAVGLGQAPVKKLFSKGQRAFYKEHAPEGITLDSLRILGPMNVLKSKFVPKGFGRKMVAEMWLYPDGTRILELSTKCEPGEAFQVAAETRAFLGSRGVDLTGEQQTKTANALKFFTSDLLAGEGS